MRIGIAYKLSAVEYDMYRLGKPKEEVLRRMAAQGKDIGRILESHKRQRKSIDTVIQALPGAEAVDTLAIEAGAPKPLLDVLIAAGGDNFFQICSHMFPDAYIAGVNTDPVTSHGALLNFDAGSFAGYAHRIADGSFGYEEWTRVRSLWNGKAINDATCTVSLAIMATDMMSRYELSMGDAREEQKATGILIVSGSGSRKGSWYRNAGIYLPAIGDASYAKTDEFPATAREIRTLTREPFGGEDCKYRQLNMAVEEPAVLELRYWAHKPSELSIDSVHRYVVNEGDSLAFRVSDKRLKVVK